MKKLGMFVIIVIITIVSSTSAQKKTEKNAEKYFFLTQAQYDSIGAVMNKMSQKEKMYFAFLHDRTVKDMMSWSKKNVVELNGKTVKLLKGSIEDLQSSSEGYNKEVADLQIAVSGDETPVKIVVSEEKTVPAYEAARQRIQQAIAAKNKNK